MPFFTERAVRSASLGVSKQFDLILHNGSEEAVWPAGDTIGPIIRNYYVIKYCTSGRGKITLGDISYDIQAGQCYAVIAGEVMVETSDSDDPWSHTWVTINGLRAGMLLGAIGVTSKSPVFPWSSNNAFLDVITHAIRVCKDISEITEMRRIAHAFLIFDELYKYYRILRSNSTPSNPIADYVTRAIYYMEMNYSTNLKITDVASYIGLNRSYFFSIFKEQTHMSPQEYLTRLRMSKACELFEYPNSTVTSVANSLGYEPSVFFRHFKRIVGISPSEYKHRLLRNGEKGGRQ
ncbi:MAG: AraC family transcriptional regulator [Clostridia bacterium]